MEGEDPVDGSQIGRTPSGEQQTEGGIAVYPYEEGFAGRTLPAVDSGEEETGGGVAFEQAEPIRDGQ